ncbi:hypothetical protein ABEG10_23425 [Burkholderia cenocepacia]|uniref:hypothetical protein n=1 Tax=Burkholderia cenocepacia TaxID=95486 RepID=UPI00209E9180|nr:hypothetical protein [Burkholderia cenocepacia]MCO8325907.1 hypothetical protein [Burkholderia cenocepacia]MCO8332977.1 hypothetical protein [Burkholderia cenocepacia]MCO8340477.1 hypothetical protein [Burkholderia cenocepacia]MCO8347763.1 hypothetical protein [Burkholderia cenocepacia]MCO8360829.1 hypothetical protein [Burkholderia cenocepacia]
MQIESFSMQPLQAIIPSYLYEEYRDDPSLQAFVDSFNGLSQGYLDWFNQTPLGLYTSPFINGPLLDWIGNGVYGIPRPVLSTQSSTNIAGFNSAAFNKVSFNGYIRTSSGTAELANDDIYKRAMTWNLYRGDGQMFTIGWLKNRVSRFINGVNGTDYPVLNNPPSITVSGNTFTITSFEDSIFTSMQACLTNGVLAFPFQYDFSFISVSFLNDGGVLWMTAPLNYPTSPVGLAAGKVWYNGGVVSVIPGGSGTGAPVYFGSITAAALLALGGGGLPTSNPGVHNQLWNNGGVISISA